MYKKKDLSDNLWTIFTSFGYQQTEEEWDSGKYCIFSGSQAKAVEKGRFSKKAYAEKAAMCVESAIVCGFDDFEITVGDSDVFDLLILFGFEKMLNYDPSVSGFSAKADDIEFANGCFKEDKCCCKFDLNVFLEVLENAGVALDVPKASLIFAEPDAEGLAYDTAYNLRVNGCIVEFYNDSGDIYAAEKYAENCGITCILRVFADGKIEIKDFEKDEIIETTASEFLGYYDDEDECDCGHHHDHGEDCDCGHCH